MSTDDDFVFDVDGPSMMSQRDHDFSFVCRSIRCPVVIFFLSGGIVEGPSTRAVGDFLSGLDDRAGVLDGGRGPLF